VRWFDDFSSNKFKVSEGGAHFCLLFVGAVAGIIISMFLSGYLADHYGWPCIFYVFGEFWFVDVTLLFWDFFFRQTVISTLDKTFLDRCLTTKNQKKQSDANNVLFFLSLGNYLHVDERFALHRIQLW